MPTVQFQEALQALRDGNQQFIRDWQSPVSTERYDGLEKEAYAAAYISKIIVFEPNRNELLIKLMGHQEKRLNKRIEEAIESGIESYASSRGFHNHVNLTIDAVLRLESYVDKMQDLQGDDYAQASIRLTMDALGVSRRKTDLQAIIAAALARSRQRHAGRGRDNEDGLGWER